MSTDLDISRELAAAIPSIDPRLYERIAGQAEAGGLLDVAYRIVGSPFGDLLLAASTEGLLRVAFEREDHAAVLRRLAVDVSPRILHAPGCLDSVARELEEYFAGQRRTFEVAVDLRLVRGFRHVVLTHLRGVEYGATRSYAELAAAAGNPAAARAVGSACSHNPIPLIVPCHRVLRSGGAIGQYLGGVEMKAALLAMESQQ